MESNLQQNFNVGFTNMKSDVLVHLTQWQYWWWFWFSLLWAFYYLMIIKMVRFRSLKFRPRIATTLRPHGKWGDLIVCIIPVSWCANIITNSNFILRMIEWQSESGALTVRIRGKQWYWVYKFELKTLTDVFTVPKNVGHNKWQISTPSDLQVADDYLHILQLRSQNRWVKSYWEELSKEMNKSKNFHMISPKEFIANAYANFNMLETFEESSVIENDKLSQFNESNFNKLTINKNDYFFNRYKMCQKLAVMLQMFDIIDGLAVDSEKPSKDLPLNEFLLQMEDKDNWDFNDNSFLDVNSNVLESTSKELENDDLLESSELEKTIIKKKPFETIFDLSDEELDGFVKILIENPVKKDELIYKINSEVNGFGSTNVNSIGEDSTPKWFKRVSVDSENNVITPIEYEDDFRKYLACVIKYSNNPDFNNFKLIYELDKFFSELVLQKSSNKEEQLFASLTFGLEKEVFEDRKSFELQNIERMESMTSFERSQEFFDFNDLNDDGSEIDNLFNKMWLSNNGYSDLLVRLTNKKSNWDESSNIELFNDSFKWFLTNEDVFSSRNDEVDLIDFIHNDSKFMGNNFLKNTTYTYSDFNEFDRNSRKSQGVPAPIRLIKYPISNKTNFDLSSSTVELFRFRFNEIESSTEHRITPNSAFLIIRQKRYKRRKVILPRTIFYKDDDGNFTKRVKSSNYTFLSQNSIILENDFNATKRYKFFKKSKSRDELTNLVLSKRILRTRRTLVLPAHLNITAITNSFDVIHSWFIPGLGLKMDAIPGRATHHTFYIDNVGFYYGQCAEICGRYHHHMPIRICALPFEHFLLWWQSFGLPKLLFTKNFRRYSYSYGSRKYAW